MGMQQGINEAALQRVREHVAGFASPLDHQATWVVFLTSLLWGGSLWAGVFLFPHLQLFSSSSSSSSGSSGCCWWAWAAAAAWGFVRVGAYVRAFCVMHDATHNNLFSQHWANRWTGYVMALCVGMDADDYRRTHGQHHAVLAIEEEIPNDPDLSLMWTTKDWQAWPRGLSKAAARVMQDPLVFFAVMGTVFVAVLNVGWPHRVQHMSLRQRCAYVAGRLLVVPALFSLIPLVTRTCTAHVVAELLCAQAAMSYALFLYHIEHVFEGVYRVPKAEYNRTAGTLLGSSYLSLPWWWRWAGAGVEYHHIHHLNARVPGYRMKECVESAPPGLWEAAGVRQIHAREALRSMLLSLWDPEQRRYVPFPEWAWLERLLAQPQQQEVVQKQL